jgi:hypothetical protein
VTQLQIQRVYDQALEIFKERHFEAYPAEHQMILCTILAFTKVHFQATGEVLPFEVLELNLPQPVDGDYWLP